MLSLLLSLSFAGVNIGPTFEIKLYPDKTRQKKAPSELVIAFTCDPTKYGVILNDKNGFSGDLVQVHFDERAVLNIKTSRASASALLLEEVWDDSEKMLIDRLKSTKKIKVVYLNGKKQALDYIFSVGPVYGELDQISRQCEIFLNSKVEESAKTETEIEEVHTPVQNPVSQK